jgi:hypothetical protein
MLGLRDNTGRRDSIGFSYATLYFIRDRRCQATLARCLVLVVTNISTVLPIPYMSKCLTTTL